jgi:hypothetical protein
LLNETDAPPSAAIVFVEQSKFNDQQGAFSVAPGLRGEN